MRLISPHTTHPQGNLPAPPTVAARQGYVFYKPREIFATPYHMVDVRAYAEPFFNRETVKVSTVEEALNYWAQPTKPLSQPPSTEPSKVSQTFLQRWLTAALTSPTLHIGLSEEWGVYVRHTDSKGDPVIETPTEALAHLFQAAYRMRNK